MIGYLDAPVKRGCISGNNLIADGALDSATRAHLAEFTTPRRMGGRLYWLDDEVLP